jgi:hypothetical protein
MLRSLGSFLAHGISVALMPNKIEILQATICKLADEAQLADQTNIRNKETTGSLGYIALRIVHAAHLM